MWCINTSNVLSKNVNKYSWIGCKINGLFYLSAETVPQKLKTLDKINPMFNIRLHLLYLNCVTFTPRQIKNTQVFRNRGPILSRERCVKSELMTSSLITLQEYFVVALLLMALLQKMTGTRPLYFHLVTRYH